MRRPLHEREEHDQKHETDVVRVQEEPELLELPWQEYPSSLLLEPLLEELDEPVEMPLERQLPLVRRLPPVTQRAHAARHPSPLPEEPVPLRRTQPHELLPLRPREHQGAPRGSP